MKSTKVKLEEASGRETAARKALVEAARRNTLLCGSDELDALCRAAGTFTNARHARKRLEKKVREGGAK